MVQGWVSLEARDGTVLLRPDAETQQRRARGTLDTSPVTRQVKLRRKGNRETGWLIWPREEDHLERMRESEGEVSIASSSSLLEGDAALVVRCPHPPALHSRGKCAEGWRMGLARGRQRRGLRCGKRAASETSLCSHSCPAKPAQDSPWEEQLRVLAPEGWREPTKREARMDGSLVGYQIFVCGYGRGRVKEYVKSGTHTQAHPNLSGSLLHTQLPEGA
eukprot:COSAG04_NODE_3642_length_2648_cov_1.630836_1_plen_219_part_00